MPRTRNIYDPKLNADPANPYKLSRSKIELFIKSPHLFYMDRRMGISLPGMPAFTLNSAVDHLLKTEFDEYRSQQKPHPLMTKYKIDAVPFQHDNMDTWRENFEGVQFHHQATNFLLTGAVDDIWINPQEELYVVDYKSTCTEKELSLDDEYKQAYKRQAEIYQWLLRQNGFTVHPTAYFVFANGDKSKGRFTNKSGTTGNLSFHMSILSHEGDDSWIEQTLLDIKACLDAPKPPPLRPEDTEELSKYLQELEEL